MQAEAGTFLPESRGFRLTSREAFFIFPIDEEEFTTMRAALSSDRRPGPDFDKHKRALQAFQRRRIDDTYADLKADAEYRELGRFFFEELYGPEDYSFRDTSIRKLHTALRGKIHRGIIAAVDRVLELQELSEDLDDRMAAEMIENGVGPSLTMETYRKLYRALGNLNQRLYQIDLTVDVTRDFFRLSHKWTIGVSLKAARSAAHLMGMGKIMDFIHKGYTAFQTISDIDPFIDVVRRREQAFARNIYNG
jgi:hypothetical protein